MTEAPFRWGWGRIIGYSAIILVVYFGAQVAAVIAAAAVQAILEPEFDLQTWSSNVETDGFGLSLATFAAAVLCVPLMRVLVGLHERAPWQFLGLRRVAARDLATACAAAAIFIAIADPINIWVFERPLVPPFMRAAYASSRSPVILFLAIAVVAPLFEELLFRGFLFGVLRARGVPVAWTVAIVTLLFTVIHTQYDLHDMALLLALALGFGLARARYDSIVPSIAMHALTNAVGFAQTVFVMRG